MTHIHIHKVNEYMPQISIYVSKELYFKLHEAGDNPSKTVQKALKKYWGGK